MVSVTDNDDGDVYRHWPSFGGGGREVFGFIIIIIIIIIIDVWVFFGSLAGSGGWLVEGGGWILTLTKASGGCW